MRTSLAVPAVALALLGLLVPLPASAHPGSGIVVDAKGQVFFTDTGNPDVRFSGFIWKVDARGSLAVDSRGTAYAAATGCRCVVKIPPDGKVQTALKAERPWSPTGVAVLGEEVYVLEYASPNSDNRCEWLPRVRKLGRDGTRRTLATLSRELREHPPR